MAADKGLYVAYALSLRIPPTLDAVEATRRLREILEVDPP